MPPRKTTTVQGMFYYDVDALAPLFRSFLMDLKPDTNWTARGVLTRSGHAGPEEVFKLKGKGNDPAQVNAVLAQAETLITNSAGPSPVGKLNVRIWTSGRGRDPQIHRERTLAPAELSHAHNGETMDLRWMMSRITGQENQAQTVLLQTIQLLQAQNASQHELIATLATQRGAATTAADASPGSIWQLLGLAGLVIAWPAIKRSFGAPPQASVAQVIALAQAQVLDAQQKGFTQLDERDKAPRPPPGSYPEEEEGDDVPPPDGGGNGGAPPLLTAETDLDGLLTALKADPKLGDLLFAKVSEDPELLMGAMSAMSKLDPSAATKPKPTS